MGCYKNRPIWSFQSIPGVFEREFTVRLFKDALKNQVLQLKKIKLQHLDWMSTDCSIQGFKIAVPDKILGTLNFKAKYFPK